MERACWTVNFPSFRPSRCKWYLMAVQRETNDPTSTLTLNLHHRSTTPGRTSPIGSKELTIQALEDLTISKPSHINSCSFCSWLMLRRIIVDASLDLYDNDKKIGVVTLPYKRVTDIVWEFLAEYPWYKLRWSWVPVRLQWTGHADLFAPYRSNLVIQILGSGLSIGGNLLIGFIRRWEITGAGGKLQLQW